MPHGEIASSERVQALRVRSGAKHGGHRLAKSALAVLALATLGSALPMQVSPTSARRPGQGQTGAPNLTPTGPGSGSPFVVAPPILDPHVSATSSSQVLLSGSAQDAFEVEISGPAGTLTAPVVNGQFSTTLTLGDSIGPNRVNHLYVTAIAPTFDLQRSAPTATSLIHDAMAPEVFVDFPVPGSSLTTEAVDVIGRVGDLLSGFDGLLVRVNGVPAEVSIGQGTNGTFLLTQVPLNIGRNAFSVEAEDSLGNTATLPFEVTRITVPPGSATMQVVSGEGQGAMVDEELSQPLKVLVLKGDGSPFVDKTVTFKVTKNNGALAAGSGQPGKLLYQTTTDGAGMAHATWTLGSTAGMGNNRVQVTSTSVFGSVFFCASGTPGVPDQINLSGGTAQRVEVGTNAPEKLRIWVSDSCNGVAGVPVSFSIVQGGGALNGGPMAVVVTDATGHAEVTLTMGAQPGTNIVEASNIGNTGAPVAFINYGIKRDLDMPTSFSGLVVDNAGRPLQNAVCRLDVPGQEPLLALSTPDGRFQFTEVLGAGPAQLIVEGVSVTAVDGDVIPTGSFPKLHFGTIIIPNASNSLRGPVRLPRLDPANERSSSLSKNTVLELEGVEGLKMFITPGSMRMPNGDIAPEGTVVSLNQVHHDDVPMPMPDGAAPPFAWTVQPGGATFDPPIRIEYPNMSALPPGAIAYFLSFDHSTEKFEIVSTAHVSQDGSTILSDLGDGLGLAGWGCNCPPYSVTTDCENCVRKCVSSGSISCGGAVTVSDSTPDHMDTIVFVAPACSDSGGAEKVNCPDGTSSTRIVPAAVVQYAWTVTKPTGTQITGVGPAAVLVADECGTYGCTFKAWVARKCPPGPTTVGSASAVVAGILDNPTALTPLEVDLSALCSLTNIVETLSAAFSGACGGRTSCPATGITLHREHFQQCCVDGVHDFERWSGSLNGSLGSKTCDFPVLGVPYLASINVRATAEASVALTVLAQQTCDFDDLCFQPQISASLGGGVSATVLAGVALDASLLLVVSGITASADYCVSAPLTAEICVGEVSVVGTVKLVSLVSVAFSHPLAGGFCYP